MDDGCALVGIGAPEAGEHFTLREQVHGAGDLVGDEKRRPVQQGHREATTGAAMLKAYNVEWFLRPALCRHGGTPGRTPFLTSYCRVTSLALRAREKTAASSILPSRFAVLSLVPPRKKSEDAAGASSPAISLAPFK